MLMFVSGWAAGLMACGLWPSVNTSTHPAPIPNVIIRGMLGTVLSLYKFQIPILQNVLLLKFLNSPIYIDLLPLHSLASAF